MSQWSNCLVNLFNQLLSIQRHLEHHLITFISKLAMRTCQSTLCLCLSCMRIWSHHAPTCAKWTKLNQLERKVYFSKSLYAAASNAESDLHARIYIYESETTSCFGYYSRFTTDRGLQMMSVRCDLSDLRLWNICELFLENTSSFHGQSWKSFVCAQFIVIGIWNLVLSFEKKKIRNKESWTELNC